MTEAPQPTSLRASVVIPVKNHREGIQRCLAGLADQDLEFEVIVVDDGSSDGTGDAGREAGARVIPSRAPGAAAARNTGVLAARGEVVLFTDADCIPLPGWAAALLTAVQVDGVVAAKGTYRTRQSSRTARFVQAEYEERYDRMKAVEDIDFLDTYSLAVRRGDLLAIGGFDEGFSGASVEDQEMSFRLRGRGRFRFVEGAIVDHEHARSPLGYGRKKMHIGRGKATLLRRHPAEIHGDSHTPDTLRYQVGAVLLGVMLSPLTLLAGEFGIVAGTALLSPLFLSLPLLRRSLRCSGWLNWPSSMALILIRGWALSLGFAWGCVVPSARLSGGNDELTEEQCSPPQQSRTATEVEKRDVVESL